MTNYVVGLIYDDENYDIINNLRYIIPMALFKRSNEIINITETF